jgi:hypothetical protein
MCGGGDSGAYAAQARADENARQERVQSGMGRINQTFSGFNDNFFNKRKEEFMKSMNPQAVKQYQQANENLAYSLARKGLTDSSERSKSEGILQEQMKNARYDIAEKASNMANQQRQGMEENKSSLIGQLNATGDANTAAARSANAANNLANQQSYSMLGNMFANTAGLVSDARTAGYYDSKSQGAQPYFSAIRGSGAGKEITQRT